MAASELVRSVDAILFCTSKGQNIKQFWSEKTRNERSLANARRKTNKSTQNWIKKMTRPFLKMEILKL
eukprot:1102017-Amphidinium_carterae.1